MSICCTASVSLRVGNQDSLQRGLRLSFCTSSVFIAPPHACWKPGLASKRIATSILDCLPDLHDSRVGNQDSLQRGLRHIHSTRTSQCGCLRLETRTRFKEDCDYSVSCAVATPSSYSVGNQDSLQRGLRRPTSRLVAFSPSIGWKPGLASKRIATCVPRQTHPESSSPLETRTRFKEDCDEPFPPHRFQLPRTVGNQDSLQRGLRRAGGPEGVNDLDPHRWKPGLASKRIARLGMPLLGADLDLKRR